jgi:hypothetical protein
VSEHSPQETVCVFPSIIGEPLPGRCPETDDAGEVKWPDFSRIRCREFREWTRFPLVGVHAEHSTDVSVNL